MAKTILEKVEEVVIQAIGHRESRNILKIINSSSNGSTTVIDNGNIHQHNNVRVRF